MCGSFLVVIGDHAGSAPLSVDPGEAVSVAPREDRLQRQCALHSLQHGEVRAGLNAVAERLGATMRFVMTCFVFGVPVS
jgi:hypothetical protein